MARRTFDVVDIIEILVHWHAGRSKSEIAQSLGVDRKTAGKYIAAAVAAGMSPGGPPVTEERWAGLAREWFPELADTRLRQVTWPAIEAHHEFIGEQLTAGVTVATIHQRLRDERGLAVSVASLRRYVAANLPEETRRSQVKVLWPWPAEPGAEAQIDYGRLGRWLDPVAGKLVTIWAFVMVLACSRHLFVRPVILSRSKIGFGWGPVVLQVSGGVRVFVDQAVEDGFSADPFNAGVGCGDEGSMAFAVGDTLRDALVRPSHVVVRLVLGQDGAKMRLTENQHAVEELSAQGADEPLADRVGRRRRLHPIQMIGTGVSG